MSGFCELLEIVEVRGDDSREETVVFECVGHCVQCETVDGDVEAHQHVVVMISIRWINHKALDVILLIN